MTDKLQPGPVLDAKIAERMGWKLRYFGRLSLEIINTGYYWVDKNGVIQAEKECWHPSTDWGDFGVVVKFMESEGWVSSHNPYDEEKGTKIWTWFHPSTRRAAGDIGQTIPEAGCLAALETREGRRWEYFSAAIIGN